MTPPIRIKTPLFRDDKRKARIHAIIGTLISSTLLMAIYGWLAWRTDNALRAAREATKQADNYKLIATEQTDRLRECKEEHKKAVEDGKVLNGALSKVLVDVIKGHCPSEYGF